MKKKHDLGKKEELTFKRGIDEFWRALIKSSSQYVSTRNIISG